MSRIQEILKKAEADGAVHRTRAVVVDRPVATSGSAALAEPPPLVMPPPIAAPVAPASPARTAAAPSIDRRLVAALAPQSLAAEQFRSLRTRVTRAENGRALRAIIITSPNKGDGKSLTAANLALTMAQEYQQRVLLIDADLRRPSLHRLFGISDTPGLSDVLMGGAALDEALVAMPEHRLTLLPAGLLPTHPAELLGSAPMRRVLDTLRTRFDRILIDMPPVAPLADVAIASPLADGVLMIVRAGVTPKPAIERALSGIDHAKVLGLVLNDAGESNGGYGYGGGYGYVAG
jgi:protein-tyrosine kinase